MVLRKVKMHGYCTGTNEGQTQKTQKTQKNVGTKNESKTVNGMERWRNRIERRQEEADRGVLDRALSAQIMGLPSLVEWVDW